MPDKIRVLLIEDGDLDVRLTREALLGASNVRFEMEQCVRLADGLERLRRGGVDALLLDLHLPDSFGIETVAKIRGRFRELPIVVLTGLDERSVGLEAIKAGVQDYLPKGSFDSELLARSILYAIERCRVEEADRELTAARQVQDRLSPSSPPPLAGFDIDGACHPAHVVGGDFFDYVPLGDGTMGILIADVCGNGLGAAMLMGDIRASIRALASTGMDASQILTAAHHILRERTSVTTFITVFFLHLDPAGRTIRYIGAGHEAYHLRRGAELEVLQSTTVPLGVVEQIEFRLSKSIELAAGDIVVLMTDGVTETQNSDRELFGLERSVDVVRASASRPSREIVDALCDATHNFGSDQKHLDDVTAVIVKVLP